jgi:hypothetical protein
MPNNSPCWRGADRASSLVASVAQLVEQLTLNQLVLGSSPSRGTNFVEEFTHFCTVDTFMTWKAPKRLGAILPDHGVNKLSSMEFAMAR